jgi:hypothetical protein
MHRRKLLQFSANYVLVSGRVPGDVQYVGFAADLAVLDVALFFPGRRIHRRLIPLAASRALETACHQFCPLNNKSLEGILPSTSKSVRLQPGGGSA